MSSSNASDPAGDDLRVDAPDGHNLPTPASESSERKSLWGKTKGAVTGASSRVASASGAVASKAASISKSGAAKTAELGKQTMEAAAGATRGTVETGKQVYSGSKLESAVNYVDTELEQRGAKRAVKKTTSAVVGKLDQVTGKRLIELLEEKLRAQDAYNDILATKLAEALDRIAKLEARFHED